MADGAGHAPAGQRDSLVVSLLTCSPGRLVYELYGHTALRVLEPARSSDWVFNYGSFSFNQPHFAWHFMLGQTDYELAVTPFYLFYNTYVTEGREITEQPLNLTKEEAKKLVDLLSDNLLPAHSTYRYNFFYDNCTTRAIRMIEKAVRGKVVWDEPRDGKTLRDIVHEFSAVSPWDKFGQDILLGAEADRPADLRKQMFAPIYAERFMETARIVAPDGTQRPLVRKTYSLLPAQNTYAHSYVPSPLLFFGILFVVTIAVCLYERKKHRYLWAYDAALWAAQGLTGCVVSFLFFFSSHPAVGSNWLVALFNPLPLLMLPWLMRNATLGRRTRGMYVEAAMIIVALAAGVLQLQCLPAELYLILAILALRTVAHFKQLPTAPTDKP